MSTFNRRNFLKRMGMAGAGFGVTGFPHLVQGMGHGVRANSLIQLAVVGLGNKGGAHIKDLFEEPGARVVAICDPDRARLEENEALFKERGREVGCYTDYQELLSDERIDGVVIASPNHWHALMGIWACQAGKDVYLEKPVTHDIWEGRQLLKAARTYKRVVQAGTQNRSDDGFRAAAEYIRAGKLGRILWVHGIWYQKRESLGRVAGPQAIPSSVDYDLWTGPAPLEPLRRSRLHYDWHWDWSTGNGDFGNLGMHQLDDCVWILRKTGLPHRFFSGGGRVSWDDDGETPNTQWAVFDFGDVPMMVEVRNLPHKRGVDYMDSLRGVRRGNVIHCEGGTFIGGRFGGRIFDASGKRLEQFPGDGGATHMANWLQAVRSRDASTLRAEIEDGIGSARLCHLANTAFRSGYGMTQKEWMAQAEFHAAVEAAGRSFGEHLARNGMDPTQRAVSFSPWMHFDEEKSVYDGGDVSVNLIANALVRRYYREPFVVPELV